MSQFELSRYRTFIFDCDGVLLDSNRVKSDAFFAAGLLYGEEAAHRLVKYHRSNGGVSRYKKFEYFLREIVCLTEISNALNELLEIYAHEVRKGLLDCTMSKALNALGQINGGIRKLVVSGGDQDELRNIFREREIDVIFQCGIFGSPDTKETILERELKNGNIKLPALFLGDSRYDHEAASRFEIDFLFVSDWTEFDEWREYQYRHRFPSVASLEELFPTNLILPRVT
jgi:phosphoglycolate phosphatase-like HAD superfamily hydrolase